MATQLLDVAGRGLEGVIVAETELSMVDGTAGRLAYRGYSIDDLARNATYEEVLYLLWHGVLPDQESLARFTGRLTERRVLSSSVMAVMRSLPNTGDPIDAVRIGVTAIAMEDAGQEALDHEAVLDKAMTVAAKLPALLASYVRLRSGQEPVAPRTDLGHAASFLYMLRGEEPTDLEAAAFNTYLVLLAEHSMNASTFSARMTTGAGSDYFAAIASALATLKGDAHGGANKRAMEMLMTIGSAANADDYIEESLATKRRLMGIGHRIYKVRDPRVNHLMGYSGRLADERGDRTWHELAERVEQITNEHPYFAERHLFPNVEFYSAPLLYMLGFSLDMMPAIFALSRIGGWSANVMEQLIGNRIYRPKARYTGPAHQDYLPLSER